MVLAVASGFLNHYDQYFVIKNKQAIFQENRPKGWTHYYSISNGGKWPIILSEDWAFYDHYGVDLVQLSKVAKESLLQGKLTRGASTITQQVVKNLFLSREKTLFRKFNEFILSFMLEILVEKKLILEKYFNLIELGPEIFGIRSASQFYFSKSPSRLSYREGAFLAMLLPSPIKYFKSFKEKKLTPFAKERVASILDKLVIAKLLTKEQRQEMEQEFFDWEIEAKEKSLVDEFLEWLE